MLLHWVHAKGVPVMLIRIRNYVLIAVVIGGFYYLLSHHFIITSWTHFNVLDKTELTLANTFYSISQVPPEETLRVEALRKAGIGEWMVEHDMISREQLDYILRKLDAEQ